MMTIGIIGVGKWGKNYLTTLNQIDPNIKILIGDRLNWKNLIKSKQCDGIIITTPPDSHVKIAIEALQNKIPVMIEKPIAFSYEDAIQLTEYKDIPILVNHLHLFSSAYEHMKQSIDPKDIIFIESCGSNNGPFRDYSPLFDYGPHDLSMSIDLTQDLTPSLERAFIQGTEIGELYHLNYKYLDNILHIMKVGNGDSVKNRLFTVFTKSDIWIYNELAENKLTLNEIPINISDNKPLYNSIQCFLNAINGINDPRLGIKLALSITKTLEYCNKALQ